MPGPPKKPSLAPNLASADSIKGRILSWANLGENGYSSRNSEPWLRPGLEVFPRRARTSIKFAVINRRFIYVILTMSYRYSYSVTQQITKQVVISFAILIFSCNYAQASKASLQNIVLDSKNENLTLSFKLEDAFSEEMKEVILSGTSVTFTFFVVLREIKDFWVDKKIVDIKIDHMLKYNVLKKEFVIKRSWQIDEVLITGSFVEAQNFMTAISSLKILPFNWLENGNRYQIAIKAELSKANLPLNLRSVMFLSPPWGFETDWYILDFNRS